MSFNTSKPRSTRSRRTLLASLIAVIAIAGIVVVYALFSQTLPQITVPGQFGLTPCSPLVEVGTVTPTSGLVLFNCSTGNAFTVSGGPGSATPTFHITSNPSTITTSLGVTSSGSCSAFTLLTNNTALTLANGGYDYCLTYGNVPVAGGTVGPVTIQWAP